MEVHLSSALEAKLSRIARQQGRDQSSLVEEAIARLVDYDEWFLHEAELGIAAADRGEFVSHEDVGKLIDQRFPG